MSEKKDVSYVFGLDIGTRNVVGTVGYKEDEEFHVVAQYIKEHETRAMLDGQIHDIARVGKTIREVKEYLEAQVGEPLKEVCIAAAGRVLKTVTTRVDYEFPEETVVTGEDIHTLDLLGIDQAQGILKEKNDTKYKFYCVGYSVVRYYLNDEAMTNLENHKAEKISEDIIVTFLPEDVVDGLYTAVGFADLEVANMTLEPIAAINVAIPENFRMLNIALVDVGAGTSDISITRDGSIIAYGMIPYAGDELTETIVQSYLVDFNTAEQIKREAGVMKEVTYKDIMGISHTVTAKEVWALVEPVVEKITTEVANKIKELNGDKTVSATFVVGGGGKVHGFTESIADKLDLVKERVALRGEEVLGDVIFEQENIVKDPLLVTPIGICLNYYDQKNNFIMVRFNGELLKLYDNNRLTVVDAALQAGFPNEELFPRRGKEVHFTVNGKPRMARGEAGESAKVLLNGRPANINTPILPNCEITITSSTTGSDAIHRVEQLEEYENSTIGFQVNKKMITCPRFVEVNGILEPPYYEIKEGDRIETRSYYTISQLAEFMDVEIDYERDILVNNRDADENTLVYENFEVEWTVIPYATAAADAVADKVEEEETATTDTTETVETSEGMEGIESTEGTEAVAGAAATEEAGAEPEETVSVASPSTEKEEEVTTSEDIQVSDKSGNEAENLNPVLHSLFVMVNGETVKLDGKDGYVFVDLFDYIDFDLKDSRGRAIVTKVNDRQAMYTEALHPGDKIEIYWKEK